MCMFLGCPVVEGNAIHLVPSMADHIAKISTTLCHKGTATLCDKRNANDIDHTPSLGFLQAELSTSLDGKYGRTRVLGDISNSITNLDSKFCSVGVLFLMLLHI